MGKSNKKNNYIFFPYFSEAILALAFILNIIIHIKLISFPLVRDEGEFAYIASLILSGNDLYDFAYNYKLPGVSAVYSLFMVLFGKNLLAVRIAGTFINLLGIYFIYKLTQKLYDKNIGAFAALGYSLLSVDYSVIGYSAMSEQFVNLFVISGLIVLLKAFDTNKIIYFFISGLLTGLSFIMKQSALFIVIVPVLFLVYHHLFVNRKSIGKFFYKLFCLLSGIGLPYLIIVLIVLWQGTFEQFIKWTITYPSSYSKIISFNEAIYILKNSLIYVTHHYREIWAFSFLGFFAFIFSRFPFANKLLILLLGIFGFLSVSAGFYFRYHYFIMILPVTVIFFGFFSNLIIKLVNRFNQGIIKVIVFVFIIFISGYYVINKTKIYFQHNTQTLVRYFEGLNPYYEAKIVSDSLNRILNSEDNLAVLGSEAEIYFYTMNKPATGYLFTYELVKPHKYNLDMQKEMIKEIEKNKPKAIVYANIRTSWLIYNDIPMEIFSWFDEYVKQYEKIGVVDISHDTTIYKWHDEVSGYVPRSKATLNIYLRKTE